MVRSREFGDMRLSRATLSQQLLRLANFPFLQPIPPPETLIDRKGARTVQLVDPAVLYYLNRGELESKNLMEGLAIDPALLLHHAFGVPLTAAAHLRELKTVKRSREVVQLLDQHDANWVLRAASHRSDTVRGWACYGLSNAADSFEDALTALAPLADDSNSSVREWAWMAARHWVVADPLAAIATLQRTWAPRDSPNLRRFCAEVTRPRGVWCAHIPQLKQDPAPLAGLLTSLCAAPERYVQNAVANNMNDCSKSNPAWVRKLTKQWLSTHPDDDNVRYVVQRACRTMGR